MYDVVFYSVSNTYMSSPSGVSNVAVYSIGGFAFDPVVAGEAIRRKGQLKVKGPLQSTARSIQMVSSGSVKQNTLE